MTGRTPGSLEINQRSPLLCFKSSLVFYIVLSDFRVNQRLKIPPEVELALSVIRILNFSRFWCGHARLKNGVVTGFVRKVNPLDKATAQSWEQRDIQIP